MDSINSSESSDSSNPAGSSNASGSSNAPTGWKKCSTCKKPIGFNSIYYVCSVSTCNGLRTGYVFCSVLCFESHVPGAKHRNAAAVEMKSPSGKSIPVNEGGVSVSQSPKLSPSGSTVSSSPQRIIVRSPTMSSSPKGSQLPREVLVIASRLKEYIHAKSEFNTSASVMDVLSDHLRRICDLAIEEAMADGRKTVMDRDFEFLKRS